MNATLPTQADILAALSRMDTLAAATLIAAAWEQMLADASDHERDVVGFAMQSDMLVDTFDALDTAVAALRKDRENRALFPGAYSRVDLDAANDLRSVAL